MTKLLKNLAIISLITSALAGIGYIINQTGIWDWLTHFFVFLRSIVKPMSFLWDFDTTFQILGLALSIMSAIYTLKAALVIKNIFE